MVAACAQAQLDDGGACSRLAVAIGGVAPAPVRPVALEQALLGTTLEEDAVKEALALIEPHIEADDDVHATAAYRRRVARVLAARAILEAAADART